MQKISTLIIGGGWLGLKLANDLKREGQNDFFVFEGRESLAASAGKGGRSLGFAPATDEILAATKAFAAEHSEFSFEIVEHRPQVFVDGHWRPFSGLGDSHFRSAAEFSRFGYSHELRFQPSLETMALSWAENINGHFATQSEITAIEVKDHSVSSVILNGDKRIEVDRIVYTGTPLNLGKLIEGEGLSSKSRVALGKALAWTAVGLDLYNSKNPIEMNSSVHVFDHGAKDFEPVLGRKLDGFTRWMTLIESGRASEHEYSGQCIRHIKRQLKRAWPNCFEEAEEERIFVACDAFGSLTGRAAIGVEIPEISNLYLGHSLVQGEPSPAGDLLMAQKLQGLLPKALNRLPSIEASC